MLFHTEISNCAELGFIKSCAYARFRAKGYCCSRNAIGMHYVAGLKPGTNHELCHHADDVTHVAGFSQYSCDHLHA
jgi:hypothetical protein